MSYTIILDYPRSLVTSFTLLKSINNFQECRWNVEFIYVQAISITFSHSLAEMQLTKLK